MKIIFTKNYYNYQILLLALAIGVLAYTYFFYIQNSNLEKSGTRASFEIIEQYCRYAREGSVQIRYSDDLYSIVLANGECFKYPVGSKIILIYNEKFDYFFIPNGQKHMVFRLYFTVSCIILSILPWKLLTGKFNLQGHK